MSQGNAKEYFEYEGELCAPRELAQRLCITKDTFNRLMRRYKDVEKVISLVMAMHDSHARRLDI